MNRKIAKSVEQEFDAVAWLSRVGAPVDELDVNLTVVSQPDAIRSSKSDVWQRAKQEGQSWLTTTLHGAFIEQYRDWNTVAASSRSFYQHKLKGIVENFETTHPGWGKVVESGMRWNAIHAFIESYYVRLCLPRPMFSSKAAEIFRIGRLPCGYRFEGLLSDAFESG